MDEGSIERLELKAGEEVLGWHVTLLDRAITRNNRLPGRNVRRRVYPWGTTSRYVGNDGVGSSPIFQPDVSFLSGGDVEVRWSGPRALIGGVAPTINKQEIFTDDPQTNLRPALTVSSKDFDPDTGECGIYFRVTAGSETGYTPSLVTPIASPGLPKAAPKFGHKLALFLRMRDGQPSYNEDDDRELFCSQGFLAVQIHVASGLFESLFWGTF